MNVIKQLNLSKTSGFYPVLMILVSLIIQCSGFHSGDIIRKNGPAFDLYLAAQKNDIQTVQKAIQNGADINDLDRSGNSPLLVSSYYGNYEIVKLILEAGANYNQQNRRKSTALHLAASQGHLDIVKILLLYGADVNKPNKEGITPLMLATANENTELVSYLLENQADPYMKNLKGHSVIQIAGNKMKENLSQLIDKKNIHLSKNIHKKITN